MKTCIGTIVFLLCVMAAPGQEQETLTQSIEQQLEVDAEQTGAENEQDEWWQMVDQYKKNPLDMNEVSEDELRNLHFLNEWQIISFFRYRSLMGKLISLFELQAVPLWDIATIKRLLPFVTIGMGTLVQVKLADRLRQGSSMFLLQFARTFVSVSGGDKHLGKPFRLQGRFKYQYKNLLQWGITADKDAGEPMFRAKQKKGFDFYSFHFFVRDVGNIKAMALGDYVVNLGQGLIQWQGMAFRKSSAVLNIKRQAAMLRPYSSAGEYNFHRGLAVNGQYQRLEYLLFTSYRKLTANIDTDGSTLEQVITSINSSGYHRTTNELEDRNRLAQLSVGAAVRYRGPHFLLGAHALHYKFSIPLKKEEIPANYFAFTGQRLSNAGVDYSYTFKNFHFFGETAVGNKLASVNGLLASVDPALDIAVLYRRIDKSYHSFFSNSFTEQAAPVNENGWYIGISWRPAYRWRLDVYADQHRFFWLRSRTDAPADGKEYLCELSFAAGKRFNMYLRWKLENKPVNRLNDYGFYAIDRSVREMVRVHLRFTPSQKVQLQARVETSSLQTGATGFLGFVDANYKSGSGGYAVQCRLQVYETTDYDSRIYAYENDVLYSASVPAFAGGGVHFYVNAQADVKKILHLKTKCNIKSFLKITQTFAENGIKLVDAPENVREIGPITLKIQLLITWGKNNT